MSDLDTLRQDTGATRCLSCGKCTTCCPLAGQGDFSARVLAGQDRVEGVQCHGELIERCLTCGACEVYCPEGIHFTSYVRGLRAMSACTMADLCPHGGVFQAAARNMMDKAPRERPADWLDPDLKVAEEGEVAFFVGCLPFFDAYFEDSLGVRPLDIARSAIRLLNRTGVEPVLIQDERCCGHDLLWGGDGEGFRALAEANVEAFASRGVKHIISACAECCRTWKVDYPEVAPTYQPRVQHVAEFLAPQVDAGKIAFAANGDTAVTFQDPCRLGRHLGITDPPRQILGSLPGTNLVEMQRSGRQAVCCGTSGFIHCDAASRQLQSERLDDAFATGAGTLVTACPKCLIHFACAQTEDRRRGGKEKRIEVKDLTVLAASRLREDREQEVNDPA